METIGLTALHISPAFTIITTQSYLYPIYLQDPKTPCGLCTSSKIAHNFRNSRTCVAQNDWTETSNRSHSLLRAPLLQIGLSNITLRHSTAQTLFLQRHRRMLGEIRRWILYHQRQHAGNDTEWNGCEPGNLERVTISPSNSC